MSDAIVDGHAIFGGGLYEGLHRKRFDDVARRRGRVVPPLTMIAEDAPPLTVRIQVAQHQMPSGDTETIAHWVTVCECGTANAVWLDQPLVLCAGCWNRDHYRRWRRVLMPEPEIREQIEAVLLLRPVRNRWWDGESPVLLCAENLRHGYPIPGGAAPNSEVHVATDPGEESQ